MKYLTDLIFHFALYTKSNSWIEGWKNEKSRYFQISLRSHLRMNLKNSSHTTCFIAPSVHLLVISYLTTHYPAQLYKCTLVTSLTTELLTSDYRVASTGIVQELQT